jgi:hypothetical protein
MRLISWHLVDEVRALVSDAVRDLARIVADDKILPLRAILVEEDLNATLDSLAAFCANIVGPN